MILYNDTLEKSAGSQRVKTSGTVPQSIVLVVSDTLCIRIVNHGDTREKSQSTVLLRHLLYPIGRLSETKLCNLIS